MTVIALFLVAGYLFNSLSSLKNKFEDDLILTTKQGNAQIMGRIYAERLNEEQRNQVGIYNGNGIAVIGRKEHREQIVTQYERTLVEKKRDRHEEAQREIDLEHEMRDSLVDRNLGNVQYNQGSNAASIASQVIANNTDLLHQVAKEAMETESNILELHTKGMEEIGNLGAKQLNNVADESANTTMAIRTEQARLENAKRQRDAAKKDEERRAAEEARRKAEEEMGFWGRCKKFFGF